MDDNVAVIGVGLGKVGEHVGKIIEGPCNRVYMDGI